MQRRIGILGGTFNPVHFGHLTAAEEVRERLHLDRVLFVPSYLPPHKSSKEIPSAAQRMDMVKLAIGGNPWFSASDIEIERGGTSYTIETVQALRSSYPDSELFFITGLDSFLDIRTWHQWKKLLKLCSFVVLSRPGYLFSDLPTIGFRQVPGESLAELDNGTAAETDVKTPDFTLYLQVIPHLDISSTEIRKRIHERRSIKYLLPESVEHYIIKNKIYA